MAQIQRLLFIHVLLVGQTQNRAVPRAGPWAKCQAQARAQVVRAWAVLSSAVARPSWKTIVFCTHRLLDEQAYHQSFWEHFFTQLFDRVHLLPGVL